jgi:prepilin-type N-terminal cleavage/methylation domain-containing protein
MEGSILMKKSGFTVLELIIVVIIIGILAVFSAPSMRDPLERGRARNAEFNLLQIYAAQKRQLLNNRAYYNTSSVSWEDGAYAINQNLSIKIDDAYFDYKIVPAGPDGYRAYARRKAEGRCGNHTMNITDDNSTVDKKGCTAW